MRIVTLEEHVSFRRFNAELTPDAFTRRGYAGIEWAGPRTDALDDTENQRLQAMDEAGITVQVLSVVGPGADMLPPNAGPDFARRYNDELARVAATHPERFAAFAHLPLTAPAAAADELERTVRSHGFRGALINGTTEDLFLDDPRYEPLLARAEELDVPLYLHPGVPPESVRRAYYGGLEPRMSFALSTSGFGWHAEVALHVLRLVLSGSLDRHPKLKLIVGHFGEGLATMLDRFDEVLNRFRKDGARPVSQTILDQVTITTSGFFSYPPFVAALHSFGVDRMIFSVDYPFSSNRAGRAFFDGLPLTPSDKLKIAHGNADRLLKLH